MVIEPVLSFPLWLCCIFCPCTLPHHEVISPLHQGTFPSASSFLGLALLHTTSLLGPGAVSLMPSLIQPTTSWLFQAQETQVPCSLLMCLRGPLSPIPPPWQGWNPNSPAAPLLVAASPGTFIFLFSSPRILRVPPQWSIDRRSGGCDPYKGSQRWDTRKGALYGVIECLADGNRGDLNGVLCCHLEREWQGQVWAIWKRHFVRCNHAIAAAWRAPAARKKYQMTHTPIFSQCSDLGSESHTAHYDSCFVSWKLGLLLSRL